VSRQSNRSNPALQRQPSLQGRFIVDTWKGIQRVKKWPGPNPVRAINRQRMVDWFKDARPMAKRADPAARATARDVTRGTGLYPDDLIMMAMAGNLFEMARPDGRVWEKRRPAIEAVMFQGFVAQLPSDQGFSGGVDNFITWDVPLIDTFEAWQPGTPTDFVVPAGIDLLWIFMKQATNIPSGTRFRIGSIWVDGVRRSLSFKDTTGNNEDVTSLMIVQPPEGTLLQMSVRPESDGTLLTEFGTYVMGWMMKAAPEVA